MRKATDLWVHNLPQLVAFLGTEDAPKFICTEAEPCWLEDGKHDDVRGKTKQYTPFPPKLCCSWHTIVDASLSAQRRTAARSGLDDDADAA